MKLDELQRHWNAFGRVDPLWSILADPAKRHGRWDVEEFFETGRRSVKNVLAHGRRFGLPMQRRHALDFGCGVGRVSQALCPHFDRVTGVDIAPSMLDLAARYNRCPDSCEYRLNQRADLSQFEDDSFDFIWSYLVLQHIAPRYSHAYVAELVRLLAPGGLLYLQMPAPGPGAHSARRRLLASVESSLRAVRWCLKFVPQMQMYATEEPVVVSLIEGGRGRVVDTIRKDAAAESSDPGLRRRCWGDRTYFVTK